MPRYLLLEKFMTAENYRFFENKGVTGPRTATCFAAALDILSNTNSIREGTYLIYWLEHLTQTVRGICPRRTRNVFREVFSDLGVGSLKGFICKRAKTESDTERILDGARQGGWRVVVCTREEHVVGLKPVSRGWKMVGTSCPTEPDEVFTSAEIFPFLHQQQTTRIFAGQHRPKRKFTGRYHPNIFLLAPEKK